MTFTIPHDSTLGWTRCPCNVCAGMRSSVAARPVTPNTGEILGAKKYPDGNPKTVIGATKAPLHLVPPSATYYTALAFEDGARKYGPYNWRDEAVSASVYYSAAKRHLDAWWDGEDLSRDAKVHHLGHVMACCAIMLDALSIDKLNDDRPTPGAAARLQGEYKLIDALKKE